MKEPCPVVIEKAHIDSIFGNIYSNKEFFHKFVH